jgi:hypothetical protein
LQIYVLSIIRHIPAFAPAKLETQKANPNFSINKVVNSRGEL